MNTDGLHPAPRRPLSREELDQAGEILTPRELQAYRHHRDGHTWDYIAQRMDVSRTRVIRLCGNAEQKLGYKRSVAAKQKEPYKPVAQRKKEQLARLAPLAGRLPPGTPLRKEWEQLIQSGDIDAIRRFAAERREAPQKIGQLNRPNHDHEDDDFTSPHDFEAERDAFLEDMGFSDEEREGRVRFSIDDGKGYDVM